MSFRSRVKAREILAGTFLNLGNSLAAEIVALAGFDWVAVDLEHGAGGELDALQQLQAITHTGSAGLVRVESANASRIAHALDSGAQGVIVPQISSAAEAAEAVAYCRYSEQRGVARFNRSWQWGQRRGRLEDADADVTCCIQIERRGALAEVDAIAAIDGVDVLFVGPADLGHALTIDGGADDPRLLAHAAEVVQAASRHGKAAGVLCGNVSQVSAYHDLGFTFLGCSADSALLMENARNVSAAIHAFPSRGAG